MSSQTIGSSNNHAFTAPKRTTVWMVLSVIAIPLVLVLLWKMLPMAEYIRAAVDWIESTGPVGVFVFYAIYVVCAVVGIPRTLFHVGAGVLFSFPVALATVLVAAATTYVTTFTIARTFAREWVLKRLGNSPHMQQLLDLVDEEGFKLVFLIRLNPFIPGVLKGYGLGTTRISLPTYFFASILGFLPVAFAHVYLGWAGGKAMLDENSSPTGLEQWLLYGGIVASAVLVAIVYFYGRRAMNRRFGGRES